MSDILQPNISSLPSTPDHVVSGSKAVQGYSYDSNAYILTVWFKGKSNAIYKYYNVYPGVLSSVFDEPGSIGLKLKNATKGLQVQKLR